MNGSRQLRSIWRSSYGNLCPEERKDNQILGRRSSFPIMQNSPSRYAYIQKSRGYNR